MSWLRKLWASPTQRPAASTQHLRVSTRSYGGHVISVPELDLIGQHSSSPSGQYRIVWQDSGWNGDSADPRGRYIVIDRDILLVDGRMDRPQDGKVADNGTFILNDWGSRNDLAGTFTAFRADGTVIVTRGYAANLLNNGLSADGRLAVCQTCNAPGSPDSSILTVFDLAAGLVRATWSAECGWANSYEFPEDGGHVRFLRRDRLPLTFSLDGEFIDRRLWFEDEVRRGTLYIIRKALSEGEATSGVSHAALRDGVRQFLKDGDSRYAADAWRLLGEVEEAAGNPAAAVKAYDLALAANPKIGVARRIASLRRSLP